MGVGVAMAGDERGGTRPCGMISCTLVRLSVPTRQKSGALEGFRSHNESVIRLRRHQGPGFWPVDVCWAGQLKAKTRRRGIATARRRVSRRLLSGSYRRAWNEHPRSILCVFGSVSLHGKQPQS